MTWSSRCWHFGFFLPSKKLLKLIVVHESFPTVSELNFNFEIFLRQCLETRKICDRVQDCSDGQDEDPDFCNTCDPSVEFKCVGGDISCIDMGKVCDGIEHCQDGSDEQNCKIECNDKDLGFFDLLSALACKFIYIDYWCEG